MLHSTNETLRKGLHIAFGFGAFALKWLPWYVAAGVCVAAILGNWLVLHRLVGRGVARHERGFDAGIMLYPVMVLLLVVVFRDRLHYAAIGWAMLAFGDGIATLAGKSLRIAPLPWNRDKSWGGFLACFLAAAIAGIAVAYWMDFRAPVVVIIAALTAAITESLALGVDDNVTVPIAAATVLVIGGIEVASAYSVWPQTIPWLIVNGVFAIVGYYAHSVSFSGALGGWFLGTILILGAGWPMYAALLAFFVIGTAATKAGYARKAKLGLAQEGGGRRGFSHAFSNVGVAAICAIAVSRLSRIDVSPLDWMMLAYLMGIASLATAAADTTASEIGQLIGRRAFLPVTLRRVPVGTEGAISIEGTLAGVVGGFLVALAGVVALHYGLGLDPGAIAIALVTACAFFGSYLESIAGSWNRKRISPVPNGVLNFFNTAAGALLMYIAWQIAI
ncbi:MAG TPA: DUF92 domain-containing protein [Thermoanaerobaculia bacterium]|jgi:uncharacterized protein (TIGR00297 family)|nr:DUF92 domain-containing protein [Thermoanaerobaculia bacterium]